jgi:alanyl-tRNA synthetase
MVEERKLTLDREGFDRAMAGQRDKARARSKFGTQAASETAWQLRPGLASAPDTFRGYDTTSLESEIVELLDATRQPVERLSAGDEGFAALAETPFYLQSGGQVSDSGRLIAPGGEAEVTDLVKGPHGVPRFHAVRITKGSLSYRDRVRAEIDTSLRDATRRNHTATHLLHAALRQVLGGHVKQAGSLVAPDRLRFDFVHFSAVTREQLDEIERIVNDQIVRNTAVNTEVRSTEAAIAAGAMALFGEKYGDRVRVVSIPGFSLELCGGTHVRATGDIGPFVITEESGVAAGVRRIEALTGSGAVLHLQQQRATLDRVLSALGTTPSQAVETVGRLQTETKRLSREIDGLKMKLALGGGGTAASGDEPQIVDGVKLVTRRVAGLEKAALRNLSDTLRDRLGSGVVVIASENGDKVGLVVAVSKDLTDRIKAGSLVKPLAPIVGGGGGGRPDFAEAGGKDPSRIDEMLAAAPKAVQSAVSARQN